jgi:hypothetical protein
MGTYKRPTSALLAKIAETGETPVIGGEQISQAQQDVAFWEASCVVLAEAPHAEQLRTTLEALFGPATRVADAWTWRVG